MNYDHPSRPSEVESPDTSTPKSGNGPPGEDIVGASLRFAKRVAIGIIGGTVVLIGAAMLVLPGPAVVVIPLGLAILATEFVWARRWLRKLKRMIPGMSKGAPTMGASIARSQPIEKPVSPRR